MTDGAATIGEADLNADGVVAGGAPRKTFGQAALQIVLADVSMSLDNVLAVAGAAREHPTVLIIGLVLLTQPAISVLAGWISFGEMLDPVDAIGMVLVAAALVVARARQA